MNPIPADAVARFTSASSLLPPEYSNSKDASAFGLERLESREICGLQKGNGRHSKGKNAKVRPEKVPAFKKPKASRREQADPLQRDGGITQLGVSEVCTRDNETLASKKARKKKSTESNEVQTKIKKNKITKPGASKRVDKSKNSSTLTRKPSEAKSAASEPLTGTQAEDAQAREEFRDLCLEKAIPRRKDWTPVKDSAQSRINVDAIERHPGSAPSSNSPEANESIDTCFGKLMDDYNFREQIKCAATRSEGISNRDGESIVKRRKIELLNGINGPPLAEKAQRTKSPKKKAQTVTGKATAPFVPIEHSSTSSLLQYFGASTVAAEVGMNGQDDPVVTPIVAVRRSSVTKAAKPKRTTTKANKTNKQPRSILLSPKSAMRTASNQELVFGTSSQLAREESPAFVEQVRQAISQSLDDECKLLDGPSARYKPYNSLPLTRSKDLWSVASRSFEGELLKAEVVDLSITPKSCTDLPKPKPIAEALELPETEQETQVDSGHDVAVAGIPTAPVPRIAASPAPQQQVKEPDLTIPRSVAEAALKKRPRTRSPVKKITNGKPLPDQMPNFKGYTDVQLSKEVASYGFKSIKKREAMITLLERCWESKVTMALQEVPIDANICRPPTGNVDAMDEKSKLKSPVKRKARPPKAAAAPLPTLGEGADAPLKKPRGRPRKDSISTTTPTKRKRKLVSPNQSSATATTAALATDEIYDSSPPTPSPPRRRSRTKPPPQLPLSQTVTDHTNISPSKLNEARLFAEVTKAISSFPPSSDPDNLTFHQKMLMYEPIILEDLTAWLNTEGLNRVGEDGEVSMEQVKAWCEGRSVCCLWRENLRGGVRARW